MSEPSVAIDVHAHIIPSGYVEALAACSPAHAPRRSTTPSGDVMLRFPSGRTSGPMARGMFELDERLADMDAMGVQHQVLSPPPVNFFHDLPGEVAAEFVRIGNDAMLEACSQAPDQLSVLAALPMQATDAALAEIDRIGDDPRVRGVAIGSSVHGTTLDAAGFEAIWSALEGRDLGVLVHPVDAAGGERMSDFYLRNFIGNPLESTIAQAALIFSGVVERHPALRFCFLHGGGFSPYQIGRWNHGWACRPEAQVVIDRKPQDYLDTFYFDGLTHDAMSLRFLVERVGSAKVVLGSDYLFDMADHDPVRHVVESGLSAADIDAILRTSALSFLRG